MTRASNTPSVRYRTIVADPPWRYRSGDVPLTHRSDGRRSKMVEGQYPTLSMREIAALPVGDLAADDAHLYLWVTNPRLVGDYNGKDALTPFDIVTAWGFKYQTLLTWCKTGSIGLGFWFRGATEHVIFATRGSCSIPEAKREPNVLHAPRRGHSEKPEAFLDLVERVSPGPYVELFARRARFGWDYWGNESLQTVEMASGL